jgi:3-phenylpropionate/trans-cinnamate dioxygenase ferredoxin subunit
VTPAVDERTEPHRVGAVGEFPLGVFRVVVVDGREIGVLRTEERFFAVHNSCPHQGAAICEGMVSRGTMVSSRPHEYSYAHDRTILLCPWHRWEFDLETGRTVGDISKKRLATYAVEVSDGSVFLRLPRRRADA